MRILLIEDDPFILQNMTIYLERRGYIIDCAMDGQSGYELAITGNFDLIVLDLMLPRMHGRELCRRLRQQAQSSIPVIMLTALDALEDRLEGFEVGTDDYLVKPFSLAELAARIKALLQRTYGLTKQSLEVADLHLDTSTMTLTRGGQLLKLPPAPLRLLQLLMQASPSVVSRQRLEDLIWHDLPPDTDSLRTHIHRIRQVIDKPYAQPLLHTVHSIGYKLCLEQ